MKIDAALADVRRIYLDTAPLIYYVEANPGYVTKMDVVITAVENNPIDATSSVITLVEILSRPLQLEDHRLVQEYRDILINSGELRLIPVTVQIAGIAADLRARYNFRTPDALHMATAIHTGCDIFLTNDMDLKRVTEIIVLALDELEIDIPKEQ